LAYHVHIRESEQAYLDSLPISNQAKQSVEHFIKYGIANVEDAFRNDPANRRSPGPYFHMDLILWDRWGDGIIRRIDFIVSDEHISVGVLSIVYIECQ